jgi:hypothetical protein
MAIPLHIEGFEGQNIQVEPAGFFTAARLLVDGQPAPKGKKPNQNRLTRNDGREVVVTWRPQLLDMPKLVVDGKTIDIVKPLHWYEWVWSALPILLIIIGGALGGITGIIAFSINSKIFRSEQATLLKYIYTLLISVGSVIVFYAAATLFYSLVR